MAFGGSEGSVEVSNIFLGHNRLLACADQVGNGREPELIDRVHFNDPKLFAIMKLINDEISSRDAMSHLFIEQLLDLVCLQLIRFHSAISTSISPSTAARTVGLAGQARHQLTCVKISPRISGIQELADLVNLSRFHFCTAFHMATGHTPHQWLTRQRIAYAKTLLKDRRLRIIDIAFVVGYETQSSFTGELPQSGGPYTERIPPPALRTNICFSTRVQQEAPECGTSLALVQSRSPSIVAIFKQLRKIATAAWRHRILSFARPIALKRMVPSWPRIRLNCIRQVPSCRAGKRFRQPPGR